MGSRMDARLSIAVVAAVFFAASAFPGISAGLEGYSPGHLALLRFLVASILDFSHLGVKGIDTLPTPLHNKR